MEASVIEKEVIPCIAAKNKQTFWQKLKSYKQTPGSFVLLLLVLFSAVVTFGVLFYLIGYILVKGIPHISADLFSLHYTSENVSLLPALINTFSLTFLTLLIVVPVGICSAIYLVEYAKRGNRFVSLIRITAETLSGIPSIVFGLFGALFFSSTLGWGMSMLAGAFTLGIMNLPTIMRTTEEALLSVPDSYREASFGLGAGRLRTVLKVVLPSAIPGILSGVILVIGRIVGETAALIYTLGTTAKISNQLFSSGRSLALHMWALSSEGLHTDKAYATAVILLVLVILINALSGFVAKKLSKI